MRPHELTVSGFRSYADEVAFDFSDRMLVGIVGPIGSGKSSILDAIAFALYGKTPRIRGETKSLINQRRDSLHVSLTFEVDGTVWKAVRSLRRGGQSQHALYRVDEDGEQPVADRVRDVQERVDAILGLDFDAFCRSVLLAQNQFAQFLEATPVERSTVLKGVFGFERLDAMREVAKGRLDAIRASLQVLTERRSSAESDRASLPEKKEALVAATARSADLRTLREEVGLVDEEIRIAASGVEQGRRDLAALDDLAALIPTREDSERLIEQANAADSIVEEAVAAAQESGEAAAEARRRHTRALEEAGGQDALDTAADLVGRLEAARAAAERENARRAEAAAAVASLEAAFEESEAARVAASEAAGRAEEELAKAAADEEGARRIVHEAHDANRALALRQRLEAGRPCPVCLQVVVEAPAMASVADIDEPEHRLARASAALDAARTSESEARAAQVRTEAEVASAARNLEAARSRFEEAVAAVDSAEQTVADLGARLAGLLGEGEPVDRLTALRTGVAAAAEAARMADTAEAESRVAVEAAREGRERARAALGGLRDGLANLAGRLGADVTVGETPDAVGEALHSLRDLWVAGRAGADERLKAAEAERAAAEARRTSLLENAGLGAGDDLVDVATEADRRVTALATEVELIERRLAELDRLDEDEAGLVEQAAMLERIHGDLRPSGFLDYVLGERRRDLAALAGNHLEALTAGRYRFSEDGEFFVLDLSAAEGRRAPASLSGGETFLASLALALALAEIVGRQGGRLDAFFLDEGFGSLDPEHIDLAMDGIERLVTGGHDRLVVVVSHVEAMRDRIEDLIVLSRHPITDHTVVESGAVR